MKYGRNGEIFFGGGGGGGGGGGSSEVFLLEEEVTIEVSMASLLESFDDKIGQV
jgi:hypothetical protein